MNTKKEIYNKIFSIQNIKKITKAMEMVSISKMKKIQKKINNNHYYLTSISKIINSIKLKNLLYNNYYFNQRNLKNIGYLIISTNRGLVGSLNINLFKKLLIDINKFNKKNINIKLILIGSKAINFFNSFKKNKFLQIIKIFDSFKLNDINIITKYIFNFYNKKNLDKLYIIYNKFINTLNQIPIIKQILPILLTDKIEKKSFYFDYLYESNLKLLTNTIINRYVKSQIYLSLIENLISEQASRMMVMKSATENSDSLIKDLKLIYNKIRQTNITQEITEIFSGII